MISVCTTHEDINLWICFLDSTIQFTRILITVTCVIEKATLWRSLIFANKILLPPLQMRKLKTGLVPFYFKF